MELEDMRVEDILNFIYDLSETVEKLANSTKKEEKPLNSMEELRHRIIQMVEITSAKKREEMEEYFGVIA